MKKIPMFKVFIPKTVNKEIIKTLKSGSLSEGPKVKKFQKLISNFIGNKIIPIKDIKLTRKALIIA